VDWNKIFSVAVPKKPVLYLLLNFTIETLQYTAAFHVSKIDSFKSTQNYWVFKLQPVYYIQSKLIALVNIIHSMNICWSEAAPLKMGKICRDKIFKFMAESWSPYTVHLLVIAKYSLQPLINLQVGPGERQKALTS
jgi:hypothetical protein